VRHESQNTNSEQNKITKGEPEESFRRNRKAEGSRQFNAVDVRGYV